MLSYVSRLKLSALGVALGLLFFAASLTPSMIPKSAVLFGVLGGLAMTIGYLIAVVLIGLWHYMQLPVTHSKIGRGLVRSALTLMGIAALIWGLMIHRPGQDSIRALMGMEPLGSGHEVLVLAVSAAVFMVLLLLGRIFLFFIRRLDSPLARFVPPRVAIALSIVVVATFSWYVSNGVLLRWGLNTVDSALAEVDALIDPAISAPTNPLRSGSPASLIGWETMGARGRSFAAGGWDAIAISEFYSDAQADDYEVLDPIRIYAGLNSAETIEARAQLVLDEMIRTKAFERSAVVIATPTGTGWVDEAAVDPLEVLFRGDIAIVSMQYSYLMSPLALFVEPDVAPDSARALVRAVQGYWSKLPEATRPKLYLFGLSLGSYGSEQALSLIDWMDDPASGALWSGPTYGNVLWKQLTHSRTPGSLVWLPKIGDGKTVRFTTQENALIEPGKVWTDPRIVYLQYPSDPITFFETSLAVRPSDWMIEKRAPDVSDLVRWYPIVTMLQLGIDMLAAADVPAGYGHLFAASHYIDAWVALSEPSNISEADVTRLKADFAPK
ncbi:alpha/beta hydrolase [Roseibium algae]|uniref:Alpha/beta-hydrolase family protein n=1 Tax=Roseibium algae TaxID=3123038 RepID=A0ABU8TMG2_9HYPH